MSDSLATLVEDKKFSKFTIIHGYYKKVGDYDIRVDVLVPKKLSDGKRPVITRFHGGCLVLGDSLFPDWFSGWLLDLAYKHSAIIVSPNYRLLPEATGLDILDDVEDFWGWLHSSAFTDLLSKHCQPSNAVEVDLDRILTAGESAGGYLSIQLALSHPDEIRSATASYPMLDIEAPHFSAKYEKNILGTPQFPDNTVTDHVAKIEPGAVITSATPPDRIPLMFAILQQGKFLELLQRGATSEADRKKLLPLKKIENNEDKLPPGGLFINHGTQDSVVPADGSEKFVRGIRDSMQGSAGNVTLSLQAGEHGHDAEANLDDEWLRDGLMGVVDFWLG
ncbi:Alpha/Beta hydrolase protein [Lipomyces doorenjongii]|uniref:Alpha/Beta hydrolase protein n=1 Tax=Lipomyces doorenjongii TaxID=383834 RepID=UPI0034CE128B